QRENLVDRTRDRALLGAGRQHERRPQQAGPPAQVPPDGDVAAYRRRPEDLQVLERPGGPRAGGHVRLAAVDPGAAQAHRTTRRGEHAADDVEARRLAGAVRADEAEDLA